MSDAISRKGVSVWLYNMVHEKLSKYVLDDKRFPSVDRSTGKWVDDCACSICHWIHEDDNGFALITKYNYCPNCGAKMEL